MIVSFGDAATDDPYHRRVTARARRFPTEIRKSASRRLDMLHVAGRLSDLASSPGNRLETLSGDLRGFHSIRVNDQWRVVFRWTSLGPAGVRVRDYH